MEIATNSNSSNRCLDSKFETARRRLARLSHAWASSQPTFTLLLLVNSKPQKLGVWPSSDAVPSVADMDGKVFNVVDEGGKVEDADEARPQRWRA